MPSLVVMILTVVGIVDLSYFRGERSGWSYEYIEEYVKLVQPSEPREDFDDRNALYVMRNHIVSASLWDHWLYIMDKYVSSQWQYHCVHVAKLKQCQRRDASSARQTP